MRPFTAAHWAAPSVHRITDSRDHVLLQPGNCYENGGLKFRGEKEKFYPGELPDEYLLD